MIEYPAPSLARLRSALRHGAGSSAIVGVMVLDLEHALSLIDAAENPHPRLPLGDQPSRRPGFDDPRWTEDAE